MSESSSTEPFIEKEPLFNAENTSGNETSDRAECSVLEVSYNIANTVLGAGAIGLPYALKESGLVFGIILLIFVGYLTHFSLVLMIKIGKTKNIDSFSQLALVSMGKVGFWFLNFFIFINGVGTMLAYLIIIGSTLPPLIEAYITTSFVSSRPFVVGITGSLIILPLLFWRDIGKKLSKFSFLGVIALPVIIVLITARAFFGPCYHKEHQVKIEIFGDHIFSSIGVMAFAFICNQTAYMNYRSLKNRTVARWSRSSFIALTFSLIISLTIAILGFFAFGDDLKSNVLNNFPVNDGYINFARAVLGCNMFVTFPMQFYPASIILII
jgi:sodium-coupled neutral amino acid transporter 11